MRHFILDHNFHVIWCILTLLTTMERETNALQEIYNFTLTVSLHYLIKSTNT